MKKIIFQMVFIFSLVTFAKADVSLYEYQSDWQDQSGHTIKLDHFKNDFVVITMVYTGCAHACPMTISKIKEIENYLKDLLEILTVIRNKSTEENESIASFYYIKSYTIHTF